MMIAAMTRTWHWLLKSHCEYSGSILISIPMIKTFYFQAVLTTHPFQTAGTLSFAKTLFKSLINMLICLYQSFESQSLNGRIIRLMGFGERQGGRGAFPPRETPKSPD